MRRRQDVGAYSITARGVNASALNLGAAISKAQTIGSRLQREGLDDDEEVRSLYVRRLGDEAVARIDVRRDMIETLTLSRR